MEAYQSILKPAEDLLKSRGFKKKNATFYLLKENNHGLINFQKSQSSTADSVIFTINIGAVSAALRKIHRSWDKATNPTISDCQWKQRIGFLLPQKQDLWWTVDSNTNREQLSEEIRNIIDTLAIPEVEKHITDENLIAKWMTGSFTGLTEYQGYLYLTTLLKLNHDSRLPAVIEDMLTRSKGKPFERSAKEIVKELESL